ncbi:CRISPR-associated endonuclease Cas1 [Marinicauda salina]|uniref:CRISPR-associated endonuclease Cas1 n=1 Tax=Marinicauda salina TaxID=2135793 RepID=A0A2U2BV02_9PROT|nr:CRISPR-associated endonuclease Cas1 [Marinicauda salina]PWE17810.1 CRISPR-associated endonuclease Cas1 [Marinicauda salina]
MIAQTYDAQDATSDDWASRCRYWLRVHEESIPRRKRRERQAHPLILTGQGLSIRVQRGALTIRDGNTHYPAEIREHRFFKGALDRPPRIVVVDGSGEITLDAIDWLAEQDIPLIRLRWDGRAISVVGEPAYAADPDKAAWQTAARTNEAERVAFGMPLIRDKIEATLENLADHMPPSEARNRAARTAEAALKALDDAPPRTVFDLIGIEGKAAKAYFRAWAETPIRWKGLKQHPVPEDWLTYASRSALRAKKVPSNRRATHPVNAMLNYAYGILEARTRLQVIAEGYDPTRGIVHGDKTDPDRETLVFDLMEPGRPLAERRVLTLLREHIFHPADFVVTEKGTCRVAAEITRNILLE